MLVYIQAIGRASSQKAIKDDVAQVSVAAVGLNHENLVPSIRIYIPVQHIFDRRARA